MVRLWHVLLALVIILGIWGLFVLREPMTDVYESKNRAVLQVNTLSRGIDEKVAMNQDPLDAYSPADLNALFESLNRGT